FSVGFSNDIGLFNDSFGFTISFDFANDSFGFVNSFDNNDSFGVTISFGFSNDCFGFNDSFGLSNSFDDWRGSSLHLTCFDCSATCLQLGFLLIHSFFWFDHLGNGGIRNLSDAFSPKPTTPPYLSNKSLPMMASFASFTYTGWTKVS